jgi:hypothetical protein
VTATPWRMALGEAIPPLIVGHGLRNIVLLRRS